MRKRFFREKQEKDCQEIEELRRICFEETDLFTDYDMLDAMIASALKRLLDKHVRFRKRVSVEEERAQ